MPTVGLSKYTPKDNQPILLALARYRNKLWMCATFARGEECSIQMSPE